MRDQRVHRRLAVGSSLASAPVVERSQASCLQKPARTTADSEMRPRSTVYPERCSCPRNTRKDANENGLSIQSPKGDIRNEGEGIKGGGPLPRFSGSISHTALSEAGALARAQPRPQAGWPTLAKPNRKTAGFRLCVASRFCGEKSGGRVRSKRNSDLTPQSREGAQRSDGSGSAFPPASAVKKTPGVFGRKGISILHRKAGKGRRVRAVPPLRCLPHLR